MFDNANENGVTGFVPNEEFALGFLGGAQPLFLVGYGAPLNSNCSRGLGGSPRRHGCRRDFAGKQH